MARLLLPMVSKPGPQPAANGGTMILVVDDDPMVTTSLSLLLKQAGYRSAAAASPAEALQRLEHGDWELVLQDMHFSRWASGEEGLELLQEIKGRQPAVPVVLMASWGSNDLAAQGLRAGAADFVIKPWTNEQILRVVQRALGPA